MQQREETGQGRRARLAPLTCVVSCCALLGLLSVSGCRSGPAPTEKNPDPLTGEMLPKGYGPDKSPPRTQKTTKAPPALPPVTSLGSNAAIAQGQRGEEDPLLGGGRRLAINGPGPQPVGAWQATPGQPGTLTGNSGAQGAGFTLQPPQPMAGPIPPATDPNAAARPPGQAASLPQAGSLAGSTAPASDYDQLQAQLKARKVVWQRQESFGDGFKFTCQVPNPFNPEFNRIYEGTARDYRSAILTVIQQIDHDQERR